MAFSEGPILISRISETTLSTSYLYRGLTMTSQGYVYEMTASTGTIFPFGVCYGVTKTTTTESEAIPVAIGGIVKLAMTTDSTQVQGQLVAFSSEGYGIIPTTNDYVVGRIIEVTTGGTHNIASVAFWNVPVLYAARMLLTT